MVLVFSIGTKLKTVPVFRDTEILATNFSRGALGFNTESTKTFFTVIDVRKCDAPFLWHSYSIALHLLRQTLWVLIFDL